MTSYDDIDDEDQLHEMMTKVEDFEDRKKIRTRIREIREKKMKEWEERRLQNEKVASDALKDKVKRADLEKERVMQAYKTQSNITALTEDRRLQAAQDGLKDRQRMADEEKRKKLELYDQIAKKGREIATGDKKDGAVEKAADDDKPKETTETTSVTSKDGKTTTVTTVQTITDKNETRVITTEVTTKTMPDGGTSTKTSKRTKIIQNQMGPGGAMAARGGLAPGGGRGRGVTRSPSAIKQMLLEWTKAMTQEYSDKIAITNFSSSWNNGLAFCALIHHFYPDAFDFDALDPKKRRYNFDLAFETAEKLADIAPLLDTDDMVKMKNPDWKCVFTYVQSFYRKLQSHERNKAMPRPQPS